MPCVTATQHRVTHWTATRSKLCTPTSYTKFRRRQERFRSHHPAQSETAQAIPIECFNAAPRYLDVSVSCRMSHPCLTSQHHLPLQNWISFALSAVQSPTYTLRS